MATVEDSQYLSDIVCDPVQYIKIEHKDKDTGEIIVIENYEIDISDYDVLVNVEIDFEPADFVDEIHTDDLIGELKQRGKWNKSNLLKDQEFTLEKKRFFCDLLDLNYHVSTKQILSKVKEIIDPNSVFCKDCGLRYNMRPKVIEKTCKCI